MYSMVSLPDFSRQFETHESSRQLWLNSVDYIINQKDRNVRKRFAQRQDVDRGGRKIREEGGENNQHALYTYMDLSKNRFSDNYN